MYFFCWSFFSSEMTIAARLPALGLLAISALPREIGADWAYSPDSYYHLQVDNCQTRNFELGPCGTCPLATATQCATLDANSYVIPTVYSVTTTTYTESCLRTATGAGTNPPIAESTCTDVELGVNDNSANDRTSCDAAGNPPADAYCGYTGAGYVDSDRMLKPVRLVRSENITVSWYINSPAYVASGSAPATRRSFMMMTQTACPATMVGRRSFLQDLCEVHTAQGTCASAGAPCAWNSIKSLCEVAVISVIECSGTASNPTMYPDCSTAYISTGRTTCPAGCTLSTLPSYTGTITFSAPALDGGPLSPSPPYTLDLYDEVACTNPRTCPEVLDEQPDIIRFSATLVGDATESMIRQAIAQIAQEEQDAVFDLVVGPGAQGQSFSVNADVRMSGTNLTVHEMRAVDFDKSNFASVLSLIAGSSFHPDQTLTAAFTAKGEAPCWERKHLVEFEITAAYCEVPCAHGVCTLTDTCVCESGWGHSATALDCARPLCPAVFAPGCSFGCCNGGNCTAPATCSCPTGWGGDDCRDFVCEPHWDATKMAAFSGEGSACENGGACVGYNQCNCSLAWTGAGCQTNVDECVETQLQRPSCSSDSVCVDTPGYFNCTCLPHFVGDGAYCYAERNATIKVFAPSWSGYQLRQRVVTDVTLALGTPADSITVNAVDESSAAAWVELRILMVVDRPPALLCEQLLGLINNASANAGGNGAAAVLSPSPLGNGLAFDPTYGVEVSEWEFTAPPPPQTFALELTLTATWEPALATVDSPERTAFEGNFKTSAATELGVALERINITGLSEGSIRVAFQVLPDPSGSAATPSVSAAAASFASTMSACVNGPAICPTFAGHTPAAYSSVETTPPPPPEIDEEALLQRQEISCYSGSDHRCARVVCMGDTTCAALDGVMAGGAMAYCVNGVCEDGMVPKDHSGAERAAAAMSLQLLLLLAWTGVGKLR